MDNKLSNKINSNVSHIERSRVSFYGDCEIVNNKYQHRVEDIIMEIGVDKVMSAMGMKKVLCGDNNGN